MSERLRIALLLAPALGVIGVLFLGGLGVGLLRSVGLLPVLGLDGPSLAAWRAVLVDPQVHGAVLLTVWIAAASTALAAVLAVATALLLRRAFAGRAVAAFLIQLNLTVPHLVGAVGLLFLLSQSGGLARLAAAGGLIDRPGQFPALVWDPYAIGIVLTYVWKEVPFIALIVLANLQALGADHESVARSLGASRWQVLRHVLLPAILPGTLSASAIVFAFTFGAYEVPALLGQSAPQALPVLAWRRFTDVDLAARPEALALGFVIALMSGAMILLYVRAARTALGRRDA